MKNAKLIELLKSFNKDEFKQLSLYIERTNLSKNTPSYLLFSSLKSYYPDFNEKQIKREKIYKKAFKTGTFDANKLAKSMTDLIGVIQTYIVNMQVNNNIAYNKIQLLKYYIKRELDKFFLQTEKELELVLMEIPESFSKQIIEYEFKHLKMLYKLKTDIRTPDYKDLFNHIYQVALAQQYRWENLNSTSALPRLEYNDISETSNILLKLHQAVRLVFEKDNEQTFIKVFALLDTHNTQVIEDEIKDVYWSLVHYLIHKLNNGHTEYYRHLFEMFMLMDKKQYLINSFGYIDEALYKNVITSALKINNTTAAEIFLEKHKPNLQENVKEEAYNFNKTLILFQKKAYSDILDLLKYTKFEDLFYNLNQRRLLVKVYFELTETDSSYLSLLIDYIHAFRKYIYSLKSIPENYINLNKNFLKFTDKLLAKNKYSDEEKEVLLNQLATTPNVSERDWLIAKIKH